MMNGKLQMSDPINQMDIFTNDLVEDIAFVVPGSPAPFVRGTGWEYKIQSKPEIRRYMDYRSSVSDYAAVAGGQPHHDRVALSLGMHLRNPQKRRWDMANVVKSIEDGMNGVAFHDDTQIERLIIQVYQADPQDPMAMLYACREWVYVRLYKIRSDVTG